MQLFVFGTLMISKVNKPSVFIKVKFRQLNGIVKMIIHSFLLAMIIESIYLMCATMKVTKELRSLQVQVTSRVQTGIQSWNTTLQCQLNRVSSLAMIPGKLKNHSFNYRHMNKLAHKLHFPHIFHH